jgi:hypothetical protein
LISIKSLQEIRKLTGELLPVTHSLIPLDILLIVLDAKIQEKSLTVKGLFSQLPYSSMGIRYHFKKLLDECWIELHAAPNDNRTKYVVPSDKLQERANDLDQQTIDVLFHLIKNQLQSSSV